MEDQRAIFLTDQEIGRLLNFLAKFTFTKWCESMSDNDLKILSKIQSTLILSNDI